ncbi:MAG TPA: hypothetical protein VN722_04040 [Hanamia sp.]|nr:hypothetical protein [Hanamia sp.]
MKTLLLCIPALLLSFIVTAQLKTTIKCPQFEVNILKGYVNDQILPTSTNGEITRIFPCATQVEEAGTTSKCGAAVYYKDKDISFYTDRDYIEIGPNFKGKLSLPLMKAPRNGLFKWLGSPQVKEATWDAFQTQYGLLILYYNKANRVDKIQFSTQNAGNIRLCQ